MLFHTLSKPFYGKDEFSSKGEKYGLYQKDHNEGIQILW